MASLDRTGERSRARGSGPAAPGLGRIHLVVTHRSSPHPSGGGGPYLGHRGDRPVPM